MSTERNTTVSIKKVGRHTKKPSVEISLAKVKRMIREAKVKVEKGKAYIVYTCGHVYDSDDDPGIVSYFADKNRGLRSCPVCISEKLLTKYKKCGCGAEHISKRIQPSKCCACCPSTRRASGANKPKYYHERNSHLADPERCFCIHREECIVKYIEYDTIPCKNCKRYKVGHGVRDPT